MNPILVCGGAGYIGSHVVRMLVERGLEVVVFDNLATGHREACGGVPLVVGDLCDAAAVRALFRVHAFDAVMHFGALSIVSESIAHPAVYHRTNVQGTVNLLDAMRASGVPRLVFSSTAAVYGLPARVPIEEDQPLVPVNPYGETKRQVEGLLADAARRWGLRSVALRYFNAAGAHPSGEIGESHRPETHLVPNILRAALDGDTVRIFGTDYATPDGTCIRDYVHVQDIARAHLLALDHLGRDAGASCFNLGTGQGFSVAQVLTAARTLTGRPLPTRVEPRRAGDPPVLVASYRRAARVLGWAPEMSSLESILESAWRWHRQPRY